MPRWHRIVALVVVGVAFGASSFGAVSFVGSVRANEEAPPSALERPARPSDALPDTLRARARALGLASATARRLAPAIYLARRAGGLLCLVTTGRGLAASCNPERTFFHGEKLVFGLAEEGDPAAPASVWIAGIARPDVAKVRARFGVTSLEAPTSADGGFSIRATPAALAQGRPTTLDALGNDGRVLQSYDLPSG